MNWFKEEIVLFKLLLNLYLGGKMKFGFVSEMLN